MKPTPEVKALDKVKGITSEPSTKLEEKKCLKCHGFRYFQDDFPNAKAFNISEVEEIRVIEEESCEEEEEEVVEEEDDVPTLVTPNVGELLLIKRSTYVIKAPYEDS